MRTIQDGDNLFGVDWMNLVEAHKRMFFVTGGGMTVGGALDVDVGAGIAMFEEVRVVTGAINLVHDGEAVFDNRYDLITVNNVGVASITKGLAENVAPDIPAAGEILIGVVRIRKDETILIASDLNDSRIFVDIRILAQGAAVLPNGAGATVDVNVSSSADMLVAAHDTGVVIGKEFDWFMRKGAAAADAQTIRFRRIDALAGVLNFNYTIKII